MPNPSIATSVVPFSFENHSIRAINRDGEAWFVAADVGSVLGLVNIRYNIRNLDDDEKGVSLTDTPSGKQEMSIINESGLYALILRSRKPEAKRFRKWVTSEVLPSIRKTGAYTQTINPAQQQAIQAAVANKCGKDSAAYQTVYRALKARFQVAKYDQIPASQFDEAINYIETLSTKTEATHSKYYYPKSLLNQRYFNGGSNSVRLYGAEVAHPKFISPTLDLFNRIESEGGTVDACRKEFDSMKKIIEGYTDFMESLQNQMVMVRTARY